LAVACFIGVVTSIIINSVITNQVYFEAQERVKEEEAPAFMLRMLEIESIIPQE